MIRIIDRDDIDAIKFAFAAKGNDEYLCIRDNQVIGIDGRRIHRAKLNTTFADDGLYNILKNSRKEIILDRISDDSNYYSQDLIESHFDMRGKFVKIVELDSELVAKGSLLASSIVYLVGMNRQAINPQYILDVCKIIETRLPCSVTVTLPTDPNSPILIKQNDITSIEALIMPVIVHEDIRKQLEEVGKNE